MPYTHWFINYIWPHIPVQPSSSAQIKRVQCNELFCKSSMVKFSTNCSLKLDRYCMFAGYSGWHSPKVFSYSIAKTIIWKSKHSVYVKRLMLKSGSIYNYRLPDHSCRRSFSDMDLHSHTLSLSISCGIFSCTFQISFGISSSLVFAETHLLYCNWWAQLIT